MNYKKYKNARDLSWEILVKEGITSLPVPIVHMCCNMGITVKLYDGGAEGDGMSAMIRGKPVIFVNKNCNFPRQRFTIAHELGHILLGHVGKSGLINREPSPNDNPIEHEANVFASRLLAPACVLWGCNAIEPENIMQLCDISYQAAVVRAKRMKELCDRNCFLISRKEQEVFQQFSEYIRKNKL